jgi:hypothetical protein
MHECACASSPDEKLRNGHTQECTDRFMNTLVSKIRDLLPDTKSSS